MYFAKPSSIREVLSHVSKSHGRCTAASAGSSKQATTAVRPCTVLDVVLDIVLGMMLDTVLGIMLDIAQAKILGIRLLRVLGMVLVIVLTECWAES